MKDIPIWCWIVAFLGGIAYSFTSVFAARLTAFLWGLCVLMLIYSDQKFALSENKEGEKENG